MVRTWNRKWSPQEIKQPPIMAYNLPLHSDIYMRRGLHLQTCQRLCPLYPMRSVQARKRHCYTYWRHGVSKGFGLIVYERPPRKSFLS